MPLHKSGSFSVGQTENKGGNEVDNGQRQGKREEDDRHEVAVGSFLHFRFIHTAKLLRLIVHGAITLKKIPTLRGSKPSWSPTRWRPEGLLFFGETSLRTSCKTNGRRCYDGKNQ